MKCKHCNREITGHTDKIFCNKICWQKNKRKDKFLKTKQKLLNAIIPDDK